MSTKIISVPVSAITNDDTRIAVEFISADGHGALDMSGLTLAAAKAELLQQRGEDEQRAAIMAGYITTLSA